MCPEKGLDTVVDAFIRLRQGGRVPNLRLKIGGGCGPSDEKFVAVLRKKLSAIGLLDDVSFHPNVSREEKVAFYAACDVLSVPAKMSESFRAVRHRGDGGRHTARPAGRHAPTRN
jgi:glycosyltransferase involved in cell wall biosynthesis